MDLKFSVTASGKTDAELLNTLDNREKYLPETIEATVDELKHRGHEFSDEMLKVISEDVQAHRENASAGGRRLGNYKNNIVQDPDAPLFYSRPVIYIFSFLFSTLFGSIMMAMNINRTDNPARMVWVVLFGAVYTGMIIVIASAIPGLGSAGIIFSIIGAWIMESFFWDRYLGNATFYRARNIWVPLIIGLGISGIYITLYIIGMQAEGK